MGFDLTWSTVDGGGASPVTGGVFSLNGTAGQPDAGATSGGSYTLRSGFWGIEDDLPTPTLMIDDPIVIEGNSGTTNAVFTVTLSAASNLTVTVQAATADGTATAGSDYTATGPITLTISPGNTRQTVSVPILGDTANEPNETFAVNLTNPTNATIGKAQGVGTIQNDDAPGNAIAVSIDDVTVTEGNSGATPATFAVTLNRVSTSTVTVRYATADGTATAADSDYQAANGMLTFNPGELTKTLTVNVTGDTMVEPNEAFTVTLSSPTNASIARAQAVGTIENDDAGIAIACSPRPAIAVTTLNPGDGRLQVTVTAGTQAPNGANRLAELRFQAGANALIDVTGQTGRSGSFTVALTDHPTFVTFFVRRAAVGAATTVPLTVVDTCGEWPTLVGGGPSAF